MSLRYSEGLKWLRALRYSEALAWQELVSRDLAQSFAGAFPEAGQVGGVGDGRDGRDAAIASLPFTRAVEVLGEELAEAEEAYAAVRAELVRRAAFEKVLNLLALLVQKHKY